MKEGMLDFELKLASVGYKVVGVDEVGRGALAGPVFAAACVLSPGVLRRGIVQESGVRIVDSKKLSPKAREKTCILLRKSCPTIGVGFSDASEIDVLGINRATAFAMQKALLSCVDHLSRQQSLYIVIDYITTPLEAVTGTLEGERMIRGDSRCLSVAAASIVAKVERDRWMDNLAKNHNTYKWERNKGYGTREHKAAILKFGLSPQHRRLFTS